jgi:hypothetical protein
VVGLAWNVLQRKQGKLKERVCKGDWRCGLSLPVKLALTGGHSGDVETSWRQLEESSTYILIQHRARPRPILDRIQPGYEVAWPLNLRHDDAHKTD